MKKFLLLLLLSLSCHIGFAHEDIYFTKDYGNVKLRIVIGDKDEELNKALIIGQLAEKLSQELNYTETIFLNFEHQFTNQNDEKPAYFVSFDKGGYKQFIKSNINDTNWRENFVLKENAIVIQQKTLKFDVTATLKLIEYAIKNASFIKNNQKEIEYNTKYTQYKFNSIDPIIIQKQLNNTAGKIISGLLNTVIYRPEEFTERKFVTGCSYYWQNNQFHFFWRSSKYNPLTKKSEITDSPLTTLADIFYFKEIENLDYVIFDTYTSFYYTDQIKKNLSGKQIIKDYETNYRPFIIKKIAPGKVSLTNQNLYTIIGSKTRTLLYLTETEELIQDLDNLIELRNLIYSIAKEK